MEAFLDFLPSACRRCLDSVEKFCSLSTAVKDVESCEVTLAWEPFLFFPDDPLSCSKVPVSAGLLNLISPAEDTLIASLCRERSPERTRFPAEDDRLLWVGEVLLCFSSRSPDPDASELRLVLDVLTSCLSWPL